MNPSLLCKMKSVKHCWCKWHRLLVSNTIKFCALLTTAVHAALLVQSVGVCGVAGEDVDIQCPYPQPHRPWTEKLFCSRRCLNKNILIRLENSGSRVSVGRYSLHDDPTGHVLTVTERERPRGVSVWMAPAKHSSTEEGSPAHTDRYGDTVRACCYDNWVFLCVCGDLIQSKPLETLWGGSIATFLSAISCPSSTCIESDVNLNEKRCLLVSTWDVLYFWFYLFVLG